MRRIMLMIVIILAVIFFSACNNDKKANDMVKCESENFYDVIWSETIGNYNGESVIPNEETALKVAKAIFDGMKKSKVAEEYEPQSVYYDSENEMWIVSFWKDSNQLSTGDCCSIALQKSDGKVLRIWFGE